jgi:hypothetical protein
MERIVGDAVSGAKWACETFDEQDAWGRIVNLIKETLEVDEWVLEDQPNRLKWIADTLPVMFELIETSPYPQVRMTVEVFNKFEADNDGWFLASNLNRKSVGGAYVYQCEQKTMEFVSYCAVSNWWDFALFVIAASTSIGQCENISRRTDILRFNKCQPAAQVHPTLGNRTNHHQLFVARLDDMSQIDFIGGLWISESERNRILQMVAEECPTIEIQPEWDESSINRNIDKLDFRFQVLTDKENISVYNDNSAIAAISFNEWTDFGRSIVIDIGLPLFTRAGIFDDGASDEQAVLLANLLNICAIQTLWERVGFGSFHVKGSQIIFSKVIPHADIKPIVIGSPYFEIADFLFDVIDPNMVRRIVNFVARELQATNIQTKREPDSMDHMESIKRHRRKTEPVRVRNETVENMDSPISYWDMPSTPIFLYGVFERNPALGSFEIVHTPSEDILVDRWRSPGNPGELVVAKLHDLDREDSLKAIEDAAAGLHEGLLTLDFFHVPPGVSEEVTNALTDGLMRMAQQYVENGVDLFTRACGIRKYPNPWWRPSDEELNEEGIDLSEFPELQGLSPVEAYLVSALHNPHVDTNLAFFQSWWQGAIAFQNDPDSSDEAAKVVEAFAQHTIDRLKKA